MTERMTLDQYRKEVRESSVFTSGRVVAVSTPTRQVLDKPPTQTCAPVGWDSGVVGIPGAVHAVEAPKKKVKKPRKLSRIEEAFAQQLHVNDLFPDREFKFHPVRKWRFDFAFPRLKIAIECEGGHWTGGRHTTGTGFEDDCEKYLEAAVLGWRVIRVTGKQVDRGDALNATLRLMGRI